MNDAPRKEDKLRPYRIDYFDIEEMKDNDLALVRSTVIRAVTAEEAEYKLLESPEFWKKGDYPSLVGIRAYRYYKKLGAHKKDVYKAVEDLFSANKALKVMAHIENYRSKVAQSAMIPPQNVKEVELPAAQRIDATPTLQKGVSEPGTGPDSAATKAVVADMQGMIDHDRHEQLMDTFVPASVPEGKTFPDPKNVPVTAPVPAATPEPLIEPDEAVGPAARPDFVPPAGFGPDFVSKGAEKPMPLWLKVGLFASALGFVTLVVLAILHHAR